MVKLQFNIKDILWATLVACISVAWWSQVDHAATEVRQLQESLASLSRQMQTFCNQED